MRVLKIKRKCFAIWTDNEIPVMKWNIYDKIKNK